MWWRMKVFKLISRVCEISRIDGKEKCDKCNLFLMKLDRLRDEGLTIRFRRFRRFAHFVLGVYISKILVRIGEKCIYIYFILTINFLLRKAQKYGCFVLHKHFDPNIDSYFSNITNAWSNQRN